VVFGRCVGVMGLSRTSREGDDMTERQISLVRGLGRLDQIVPAVRNLGVRHAGYGVRDEHYDIVVAALLWTLEQGLGEKFTAEVADAWTEAYGLLATTMRDAAGEAAVAA
jgi:hemoglobin-like flavoprotein